MFSYFEESIGGCLVMGLKCGIEKVKTLLIPVYLLGNNNTETYVRRCQSKSLSVIKIR